MNDLAIKADGLSKVYRIGVDEERPETLFGAVSSFIRSPMSNFRKLRQLTTFEMDTAENDVIWALKDVSFALECGEVLGIIGRNGAGKSTLLKVLSRITEPTFGRVEVYGRVASLLEVGTGFHPDLSGRENIYLNGTILGMKKREIDQKFDEIVEFSEVERFIDTPVKRYSSGMRVRLAFSVAAHLEPEILVIDEVLAVGDAAFQKKCMGKMGDVASQGRTVLFVSHNMAAVKSLCTQGLVMKSGAVVCRGGIDEVIAAYLATKPSETDGDLNGAVERDGEGPIRFTSLKVFDQFGRSTDLVQCGQEISIELGYASANGVKPPSGVVFHIYFTTIMEERLFICSTQFAGDTPHQFPGAGTLRCSIPCLSLLPGQYRLDLACHVTGQRITMDRIRQAKILTVVESDFFGSGKLPPASVGPFLVSHSWQLVDDQLAAMNAE